jgi:hypothetical protein
LLGGFEQGPREELIDYVLLRHGPHRKYKFRGYTQRHTDRKVISKPSFYFFQNMESKLKMRKKSKVTKRKYGSFPMSGYKRDIASNVRMIRQ